MNTLRAVLMAALLCSITGQTLRAADDVVDKVDKSAHKAKRTVKHHVRKTTTDIKNATDDNGARKAGRRVKDAGNDAVDKVDDTVHGH
jgi:predicted transcriptional regulator